MLETLASAADSQDAETAIATLTYRLVATQVQERLSVAVSVQG